MRRTSTGCPILFPRWPGTVARGMEITAVNTFVAIHTMSNLRPCAHPPCEEQLFFSVVRPYPVLHISSTGLF